MSKTQKHTKPNVPNLRFPGFEGEWGKYRLKDIVDRVTRKNKALETSRPLTISAQYGLIDQRDFFKKTVASQDLSNYYLLFNGEFAYNKSYSAEYPWGAIKRLDIYDKGVLSSLYFCFKPKETVESDYLVHYFESTKWHQGVADIAGEGARNHGLLNIAIADYFNTIHYLPNVDEQRKIARFLNLIEKRIAIQNKIIERYESLIKALAYEIIGKHQPNALLIDIVSSTSSTLKESDLSENGDIPAYGASGLSGYTEQCLSKRDSILITKDGSGVGSLRYVSGRHSFVGTQNSLIPKEGVYLPYVYYALFNVNFETYKTGQAIPHIYFKDYAKEAIYCPMYEDQKRLAKGLELIDSKLEYQRAEFQALLSIKKYLLTNLFI